MVMMVVMIMMIMMMVMMVMMVMILTLLLMLMIPGSGIVDEPLLKSSFWREPTRQQSGLVFPGSP